MQRLTRSSRLYFPCIRKMPVSAWTAAADSSSGVSHCAPSDAFFSSARILVRACPAFRPWNRGKGAGIAVRFPVHLKQSGKTPGFKGTDELIIPPYFIFILAVKENVARSAVKIHRCRKPEICKGRREASLRPGFSGNEEGSGQDRSPPFRPPA